MWNAHVLFLVRPKAGNLTKLLRGSCLCMTVKSEVAKKDAIPKQLETRRLHKIMVIFSLKNPEFYFQVKKNGSEYGLCSRLVQLFENNLTVECILCYWHGFHVDFSL